MVLLVGASTETMNLALRTAAAIGSFVVGCALGARIAGQARAGDGPRPRQVTTALAVELVVLCAYAAVLATAHGHPTAASQGALLAASAFALGIQSSAINRFGVSGLSTTYLTGT